MKSIVISINPEHALNILNGVKTLELRKSVPKGFVGWVYGYVSKRKPYLYNAFGRLGLSNIIHNELDFLNATIPFRFWFDEYEEVLVQHHIDSEQIERVLKQACIEHDDLDNYVGNKETIYAWHIKKLEIFDKPMGLMQFHEKDVDVKCGANDKNDEETIRCYEEHRLTKAPQSYQYVWVKGESNE